MQTRAAFLSIVAATILITLFLPSTAGHADTVFNLDDFYPADQGDTWTYRYRVQDSQGHVVDTTSRHFIEGTVEVPFPSGDSIEGYRFFTEDIAHFDQRIERVSSRGLESLAFLEGEDNSFSLFTSPDDHKPVLVVPRSFEAGQRIRVDYQENEFDSDQNPLSILDHQLELIFEPASDVRVQAGRFTDTLKVNLTEHISGPSYSEEVESVAYYAEGIGRVKEASSSTIQEGGETLRIEKELELIEAKVKGEETARFPNGSFRSLPVPEQAGLPRAHLRNLLGDSIPFDPDKPTIVIVHGANENAHDWVQNMGSALELRFGQGRSLGRDTPYNVAAWSWEREAGISPKGGPVAVDRKGEFILDPEQLQGSALGAELRERELTKQVHFIGHGGGGTVATSAAHFLESFGIPVSQVTLLDAPNQGDLTFVRWADNYIGSSLGSPTDGAFSYHVLGPSHANPYIFYTTTIQGPYSSFVPPFFDTRGFYWSEAGRGVGSRPSRFGSGSQELDMLREGIIVPHPPEEPPQPHDRLVTDQLGHHFLITNATVDTFDVRGHWFAGAGEVNIIHSHAELQEHSPAVLFQDLTIPPEADFFNFDFRFVSPGDGDFLTAHFDDTLLYWFDGRDFFGDNFRDSGMIPIDAFTGKHGQLAFTLYSVGEPNAEVWLDNVGFYDVETPNPIVPEPSSLFLVGFGLLGLVGFARRRPAGTDDFLRSIERFLAIL